MFGYGPHAAVNITQNFFSKIQNGEIRVNDSENTSTGHGHVIFIKDHRRVWTTVLRTGGDGHETQI